VAYPSAVAPTEAAAAEALGRAMRTARLRLDGSYHLCPALALYKSIAELMYPTGLHA
jgi:hypothetical protein